MTPIVLGGCSDPAVEPAEPRSAQPSLTHSEYQQAIQDIVVGEDARAATRLYTDAVATEHDTEACAQRVRGLHDHLQAVIDKVQRLQPPADAQHSQGVFLEAAQESVRLVGVAAEDSEEGDLSCGQSLNERIYGMPSTQRAQGALEDMEKRGYVIFGD